MEIPVSNGTRISGATGEFTTNCADLVDDPRDCLFAATQPLFAARLLLNITAGSMQEELCVMDLDISCALLHAKVKRTVYSELPVEDEVAMAGGRKLDN